MKIKKYLILFAFFIMAFSPLVCANDWGIFDNYEENFEDYALYKVLNDIPIKYAIEIIPNKEYEKYDNGGDYEVVANGLRGALDKEKEIEDFKTLIENAFNAWGKDTINMIKNEGRAEEFEDIISVLPTEFALQEVSNKEDADIVFIFTSYRKMLKECRMKASACFIRDTNSKSIVIVNPYEEGFMSIMQTHFLSPYSALIHEIGHYYGLTDQYKDFNDSSLKHSTFNRMGKKEDAIMASNPKETLSCDDVDGFINLIDLTLALEDGEFSPRASQEEGWASFCNGKKNKKGKYYKAEFYKKAQLFKESYNNGKYSDKEGSWQYYEFNEH